MAKSKNHNKLRILVLAIVGGVAFVVSVYMNVVGMKAAINKEPDSSGMSAFSVRTKEESNNIENKKEVKTDNDGKVVLEDFSVNAIPIINLNNNNWDRMQAKFSGFELDENGNAVFEKEGYILFCNGKYVKNIVFNTNYEKNVVGNLKVGADFKTIKEKLGNPTFKRSGCIGYKSREVYVFFYDNQIAVYPNRNVSNESLEELFINYANKNYDKGRTRFLVEIRNNYPDIEITQDDEKGLIILKSTTRQLIAKLDGLGNIEVEFYNGYKISNEETKEFINKKIFIQNDEDLVEIVEEERVSGR